MSNKGLLRDNETVRKFMTAVLLKNYVDDERAKDALNKGLECFENCEDCDILSLLMQSVSAEEKKYHMDNLWKAFKKMEEKEGRTPKELDKNFRELFVDYINEWEVTFEENKW